MSLQVILGGKMAGSEFRLDVSELEKLSAAMAGAALINFDELLNDIGVLEKGEIQERFESKTDPDGNAWADWSPVTEERQSARGGASVLIDSGALQDSINFEVTADGVIWGSALVYARIHQEGGKAGRGRQVTIPARPYLGIGQSSKELIAETMDDFLTRHSGGLL